MGEEEEEDDDEEEEEEEDDDDDDDIDVYCIALLLRDFPRREAGDV